jgi:hypothetical protein
LNRHSARTWRGNRVYFLAFSLSGPDSAPYREVGQNPRSHRRSRATRTSEQLSTLRRDNSTLARAERASIALGAQRRGATAAGAPNRGADAPPTTRDARE